MSEWKEMIQQEVNRIRDEFIEFVQSYLRIRSCTGFEKEASLLIKSKMEELGYRDVHMDEYGSVLGTMGSGNTHILFDGHMDVVMAEKEDGWDFDPFGGEIIDGYLCGRGSVDMKCNGAAAMYAIRLADRLGFLEGKTIYMSMSVMEEDIDGRMLDLVIAENQLQLDYSVICEPSQLQLSLGHNGRSMFKIITEGISSHGSQPQLGVNAIYKMIPIMERAEKLQQKLMTDDRTGSIALTNVTSRAASLNAVPDRCEIYLDRRMTVHETKDEVFRQLDELVEGTDARWEVYIAEGKAWTGKDVELYSYWPAWEMKEDDPVILQAAAAFTDYFGCAPHPLKWNFSTNGFATAGLRGIPTVGFGSGHFDQMHAVNERNKVEDVLDCLGFYADLLANMQ